MQLKNKTAVIYGGAGAIGSAVAAAFTRQGAKVYLTGRNEEALKKVIKKINASGSKAEYALLDALDEEAINDHLNRLIEKEGRIDISFNAMGIPQTGVQGIPLIELTSDGFMLPVMSYIKSHYLTAKAAAKYMATKNAGVIMLLTAIPSKAAAPLTGGMAPSWAALEALTRSFAAELGPMGIRVVCLRADGMPETDTITEVFGLHAKGHGMGGHKDFQRLMENMTLMKRLPRLSELAGTAVFLASDNASGITGSAINVTCGSVVD